MNEKADGNNPKDIYFYINGKYCLCVTWLTEHGCNWTMLAAPIPVRIALLALSRRMLLKEHRMLLKHISGRGWH